MSLPQDHLKRLAATYPKFWRQFDELRQPAMRRRLGDWPNWCYCPMAGAYAIASGGGDNRVPLDRAGDIGGLAALAAWRSTQGIYVYDETLLDMLWSTPLDGAIPCSLLERLPEWAPYLEVERELGQLGYIYGAWPFLEHDAQDLRMELRLCINLGDTLCTMGLHLAEGRTVEDALRAFANHAAWQGQRMGRHVPTDQLVQLDLAPLVNLVLYLCAENADLMHDGRPGRATHPTPTKTRRGERLFPPREPRKWEVGWRLGAALRRAQRTAEGGEGFDRQGPRPHIRRAHWHTFLTGPRAGEQKRVLRWLPPIPVNVEGTDDLVPTVRRV